MISTFTVLFDANVFFGARLRSLTMYAALSGLFRARWSEDIHREWMEAVVKKRPDITLADLDRTRHLMDKAIPDCLVTGYEGLINALSLPDLNDRHVLAAAIVGSAAAIVTFNEADFPAQALAPFKIHTRHPDQFFLDLESLEPGALIEAARADLAHYDDPPLSVDVYLEDLRKAGIQRTAEYLSSFRVLLA